MNQSWKFVVIVGWVLVLGATPSNFASAKSKKPSHKPAVTYLGEISEEDFEDYEDLELTITEYDYPEGNKVPKARKVLRVEVELDGDSKPHYFLEVEELFGSKRLTQKETKQFLEEKVETVKFSNKQNLSSQKNFKGKSFDLYKDGDPHSPDRCWAEGSRVLTPHYSVYNWDDCYAWAYRTTICRQVQFRPGTSLGCYCTY